MKVIFLDMDGVLVQIRKEYACRPLIIRECVDRLSDIIYKTDAVIVLSSSWRYILIGGDMTPIGFCYMLRSHGLTSLAKVIGHTRKDEGRMDSRSQQIADWMSECKQTIESFVIFDDQDIPGFGERFLQTNAEDGITEELAKRAIEILGVAET